MSQSGRALIPRLKMQRKKSQRKWALEKDSSSLLKRWSSIGKRAKRASNSSVLSIDICLTCVPKRYTNMKLKMILGSSDTLTCSYVKN